MAIAGGIISKAVKDSTVKSDISEFSYGFVVVNELANWPARNLRSAPYFPSLRSEARLGYDVKLDRPGLPLFLQFKLSDRMVRNNAKEIRDGLFSRNSNFYRMHLRCGPGRSQHRLLLALEDKGEEVYYVAPAFSDPEKLTSHFVNRTVCQNSIFARPSFDGSKGRIRDNAGHHISFMLEGPWFFYSEPEKINADFSFSEFSKGIDESLQRIGETPLHERMGELLPKLIQAMEETAQAWRSVFRLKEQMDSIIKRLSEASEQKNEAAIVSYISSTFFNCQFLVVQKR